MRSVCFLAALLAVIVAGVAAEPVVVPAMDSVRWDEPTDLDAAAVLAALRWEAGPFEVQVEETPGRDYDARVTFASPQPSGDVGVDTVVLRWYRPTPPEAGTNLTHGGGSIPGAWGKIPGGVGVLLVHTLHPDLPVATLLGRGLRARGVDGFVLELPGYGSRESEPRRMTGVTALMHGAQAAADCRRAFDAIKALSEAGLTDLDPARLVIQGTSLGSFFATVAAGIDGCFAQTFLVLSGGDGVDILTHGQKDAYHLRGALEHYGYTADKLHALLDPIEPLRMAGRLDPQTTWMFNARNDLVVPAENATQLAAAIGLTPDHHVWMAGNHYTSFILLPGVLERMEREMGVAAVGVGVAE